ncbi:L-amino acid N-acyltransferase YncA [Halobacillus dabanensis]|uniref:L-amino acid N-acyltransferase YncA n=1 Tax=Halobacillus dabanensis TaxID=240302 RepID=A0A1I3Q7C8_HALDA|nr:GNAT family N-acetyltransferase [Halobacillus dabanensis]SFJ29026.1 L-amino acid N-acyltransferase YncA [Halobacillus dabanensis]
MKIRKAVQEDVAGIARVHVDSWLETYQGIVPDAYLNGLRYEKRERLWKKNLKEFEVLVAETDTGHVVGFASWGLSRTHPQYSGELNAIYLLQGYQGKGLGRKLFEEVVAVSKNHHIHSMMVKVLEDNKACSFYEAMGGREIDTIMIEIEGEQLRECIYGWEYISNP